jgi:hypothetical protein
MLRLFLLLDCPLSVLFCCTYRAYAGGYLTLPTALEDFLMEETWNMAEYIKIVVWSVLNILHSTVLQRNELLEPELLEINYG